MKPVHITVVAILIVVADKCLAPETAEGALTKKVPAGAEISVMKDAEYEKMETIARRHFPADKYVSLSEDSKNIDCNKLEDVIVSIAYIRALWSFSGYCYWESVDNKFARNYQDWESMVKDQQDMFNGKGNTGRVFKFAIILENNAKVKQAQLSALEESREGAPKILEEIIRQNPNAKPQPVWAAGSRLYNHLQLILSYSNHLFEHFNNTCGNLSQPLQKVLDIFLSPIYRKKSEYFLSRVHSKLIEIEEQKTVDSQLERLLSDLIHLRQENNEMAKRLSIA
ncbi:hypothetical protein DdX_13454 [Ditylenchus destructor]|uniref:Uncharacterized protein n=1 Tax=Ditylenchus destructor TaxID=166010 RepID=A0AAD4QWG9_9BILA|nr:hypothetical protein DdX_13454 [Ditylenchus destructor]